MKTKKSSSGGRSKKYLNWIRGKACWFCGFKNNSDPHHLRNLPNTRRFQDFDNVVPLCGKKQAGITCHKLMQDTDMERDMHDKMKAEAVRLTKEYKELYGRKPSTKRNP